MDGADKGEKKQFRGKRPPKFDHRKKFGAKERYSSIIDNETKKLIAQYDEVSIYIER